MSLSCNIHENIHETLITKTQELTNNDKRKRL